MAVLILSLFVTQAICAAESEGEMAELLQSINERLGQMQDVALYKATHQLPIEDLDREAVVIARASQAADAQGLDAQTAAAFFMAQVTVAKAIQFRYRADLLLSDNHAPLRDLNLEIRPALIELGDRIVALMASITSSNGSFDTLTFGQFDAAIDTPYVNAKDKCLLFRALRGIRRN